MVEDQPVATLRYVVADVFTDVPLAGNQLAVFTDGRGVDDETMQKLAREMNVSETVFVLPPEAGGHARIRIFTPATELPFAGHPELGAVRPGRGTSGAARRALAVAGRGLRLGAAPRLPRARQQGRGRSARARFRCARS